MRTFVFVVLGLLVSMPPHAHAQAFPPFPVMQEMEYPRNDIGAIRARSDAGEGYATLRLAGMTRCAAHDEACETRLTNLYRLAAQRGQTAALAMLRLRILEREPSRTSEFSVGSSVCARTRSDAQGIVRQITSIEMPDDQGQPVGWQVQEAAGSRGSNLVSVSRGPVSASLLYVGDQLRLVRVFTNFLAMGNHSAEVQDANASIATAVCPQWSGLGEAISGYLLGVAQSWPPQAIHVDGPSAWLAATGVTPDIFWFDLYVDPLHNPFTSAGSDEQFQRADGLGLASDANARH